VALGPSIVTATEHLKLHWNVDHWVYFECGSTQNDVAYWFNHNLKIFGVECLIDTDYTLMDRSQNEHSLRFARWMCEVSGVRGLADMLLKWQEGPQKVYSKRGDRVDCSAFLRSGVPNTTLYNSVVNAAIATFVFIINGGVPGRDFVMMVRGDDNLMFAKPGLEKDMKIWAEMLGFTIKVNRRRRIEDVRFCSNAFYPTDTGDYVPAPTLGKCLAKLSFSHRAIPKGGEKAHMRGVALGLLALTNHVPILHDFLVRILELTEGARGNTVTRASAEVRVKYFVGSKHLPSPEAEHFVCSMYDVTPAHLDAMKHAIQQMSQPGLYGSPITHDFWQRALEIECG